MRRRLLTLCGAILGLMLYAPAARASDLTGTEVQASTSASTAYVAVTLSDVRGFEAIDWVVDITALGSATDLACIVQIETSVLASPGASDWAVLQSESISAGTATESDYTYTKSSITAVARLLVSSPVRGRSMRIKVKYTATTLGGTYAVKAYRRASGDGGQIKP